MSLLRVSRAIQIPLKELHFTFVRSSGSGGQKVNKTSSAAQMSWNLWQSQGLSEAMKSRLAEKLQQRLSAEGVLQVRSSRYRERGQNVADCLEKLRELLQELSAVPKRRVPTKKTRSSIEKRLKQKKRRSDVKASRRKKFSD